MTTHDLQSRTAPYRIVGTSPAHHDFVDKVKGSLHYAADWQLPGLLHGRVVRSPVPSARITGLDVTAARALPGVIAVLTALDLVRRRGQPSREEIRYALVGNLCRCTGYTKILDAVEEYAARAAEAAPAEAAP